MNKWLKFLMCWLNPLLISVLLLSVSGCFSALGNLNINGGGASTGEKILLGALDVVTFPAQVVVFGPLIVGAYIDENTGERGRQKRAREAHQKKVESYWSLLQENPDNLYSNSDFMCATNQAAMEGLEKWFQYDADEISQEKIYPYGEKLLKSPQMFRRQGQIFYSLKFPAAQQRLAYETALKLFATDGDDASFNHVRNLLNVVNVTDEELKILPKGEYKEREKIEKLCQHELKRREQRRKELKDREEQEKKRREEEARRQQNEMLRRQEVAQRIKKRQEELRLQEEARREALRPIIASIEKDALSFKEALKVCRDHTFTSLWQESLQQERALPIENLRLLAEELLRPGWTTSDYLPYLLIRPEFQEDDLRRYYELILARLKRGWRNAHLVSALLHNPKCPKDLVTNAYNEPLLIDLHYAYFMRHTHDLATADVINHILKSWKDISRGGAKFSPQKRCSLLKEEIQSVMPKEPPKDWVQTLPISFNPYSLK